MYKSATSALILLLVATDAYAEDEDQVMQRFTQSMRELYKIALFCEYAVSPSSIVYAHAISSYVQTYYPGVDSPYWALPVVDHRARNSGYCITSLQRGLMRYAAARNDFAESYEDHPLPPPLAMVHEVPVRITVVRRTIAPAAPERFRSAGQAAPNRFQSGTTNGY